MDAWSNTSTLLYKLKFNQSLTVKTESNINENCFGMVWSQSLNENSSCNIFSLYNSVLVFDHASKFWDQTVPKLSILTHNFH